MRGLTYVCEPRFSQKEPKIMIRRIWSANAPVFFIFLGAIIGGVTVSMGVDAPPEVLKNIVTGAVSIGGLIGLYVGIAISSKMIFADNGQ